MKKPTYRPHLVMVRGLWRVWWKDRLGKVVPPERVSFMTRNSKLGKEARTWAAQRNACAVAFSGPWNCRCLP